ncbi:MAG: tetratricopeptide repeat protein [Treponema sp.]|nr:tetratricopeptide repeat protein [Treponema sp.]
MTRETIHPKPGRKKIAARKALVVLLAASFPLAVSLSACSSAPSRPDEVFAIRNAAANQLSLAHHNAGQGRFGDALVILEDAWRLALTADDPPLRVNIAISRAGVLFSLGRSAEAFQTWESAAAEGDASGLPALAARARIYAIRARLVQLSAEYWYAESPQAGQAADAEAQGLKEQVLREISVVRRDAAATASGYITLGMAEKQLRRWAQAEAAAMRALGIYERGRLLADAAYAWFVIASIRSVAGNYDDALAALRTAIAFDRRAENGFGLASSWHAMGDVYRNSGRAGESRAAHRRAADIYRAIGLDSHARELERLLQ